MSAVSPPLAPPEGTVPARLNPFRSACIHRLRYRLDEPAFERLLTRFAALGHRAALVGGHGSGKTTLLRELEQRLAARGFTIRRCRLTNERRRPTRDETRSWLTSGASDLLTLDGGEQLSRGRWWLLRAVSRRAGGLLVTTHRAGMLPALHEHRTSPELLTDLVAELVGARRSAALGSELARLFEAHRGDIRECLRSLYDRPFPELGRESLPPTARGQWTLNISQDDPSQRSGADDRA